MYKAAIDAYAKAETAAVSKALELGGYLEAQACKYLGLSKTAFRHLVTKRGLREEYDRARRAMGYETGRPGVPGGRKGRGA